LLCHLVGTAMAPKAASSAPAVTRCPLTGLPITPKRQPGEEAAASSAKPAHFAPVPRMARVAPPRTGFRTAGTSVASQLEQAILEETRAEIQTLRAEVEKVVSKQQSQDELVGNLANQLEQVKEALARLDGSLLSAQRDQDLLCDVLQRQMAGLEDRLKFACEDLVNKATAVEDLDAGDIVMPKVSEKCEFFHMGAGKAKKEEGGMSIDRVQAYLEEMRSKESLLDKLQSSVADLSRQQAQQLSIIAELRTQVETQGRMSRQPTDWSMSDHVSPIAAGIALAHGADPNQEHLEAMLAECRGEAGAALTISDGDALTEATAKRILGLVRVNFDMLCGWSTEVSLLPQSDTLGALRAAFLLHVLEHCNVTLDEMLAADSEELQSFLEGPAEGLVELAQEVFHAPSDTLEYAIAAVLARRTLAVPDAIA